MILKEKISLEKVCKKEPKLSQVEFENNREAVITHFLHNKDKGVAQVYKKDAIKFY